MKNVFLASTLLLASCDDRSLDKPLVATPPPSKVPEQTYTLTPLEDFSNPYIEQIKAIINPHLDEIRPDAKASDLETYLQSTNPSEVYSAAYSLADSYFASLMDDAGYQFDDNRWIDVSPRDNPQLLEKALSFDTETRGKLKEISIR